MRLGASVEYGADLTLQTQKGRCRCGVDAGSQTVSYQAAPSAAADINARYLPTAGQYTFSAKDINGRGLRPPC